MAVDSVSSQKTIQDIINASSAKTSDRNTGELGKDDFLNLLVTQLRYQDPLKPVDDKEFIGQMAQFSSLEQMQNMNNSLSQSQGFALIGKHIQATIKDKSTSELKAVEGDVTSVKVESGKIYVMAGGEQIPIEAITNVTENSKTTAASDISKYTGLIGYNVNGVAYDSSNYNVVSVGGVVKAIQRGVYEDYAVMDAVSVNVSGVVTDKPSTDPNFVNNYLNDNVGKTVSIDVKDAKTAQAVPVTGTLKSFTVGEDGKITAVLDDLRVPVESIATITKT